ncbi:MAG: translocation/assembly module TamB domain-containing protein, partial [Treponema sp.]|nr:translocation/assembly module TamB domain-containing protein [Treponema sp.]
GMGSWSGYAQGEGIPIPGKEGNALLSFMLSLRYDSPEFWYVELDSFEIRDIDAPGSSLAMLRLSGYADQTGGSIPDIYYDDGLGALSGRVTFSWEPGYRNFIVSAGIMDSQGKERYNLNGSYADGRLLVNLSGEGMQLARVTREIKDAAASGAFSLDWNSIEDFKGEASLKSLAFKLNDINAKFSAEASLDPNGILVRDVKLDYGALELSAPFLEIDRQKGLAKLNLEIHGAAAGRGVDISMRGDAAFDPLDTWLDLSKILDSVSGTVTMDTARYDTLETEEPFNFLFSCVETGEGRQLALSGGPRNMIRFRYTPEGKGGDFYAAFSSPSPIRGSFIGFIGSGNIDAQVSDLYVDLGALWRFVPPNEHVGFSGGIVSASLRIAGPLRDPEFFGTAQGTSIKMQVPEYISEDVRPEPVTILLEGSEMSFGPANATVGSGSAIVSAWFRFDRWVPNIFNIDINVSPEDPIPFGFDISGLLARGSASGFLKLSMEDLIFTASGDLTGHNTEISIDGAELASTDINTWDTDSKVSAIVDLTIRTGKRVEFFWPSFELPVLQAYTDLGTSIHVSSDETSRRFSLEGDVRMRSGEIFYLDRNFYIREGTLFFNETETEFDPRITARAEIRDQSEDGPVTISMIIENAPLMSFVPRFESNPPLSQLEIFSILGQNPQGASANPATRNIMIGVAADAFTQFTVMRRLQREVRNFLNLDMFSVRTQVLQNVVFQAVGWNDSASSGGTNDDNERSRTRAGNYFDNTTIFFGKYIGSDIFLQSLFTFRYDKNKQEFGGMNLEPDIGLEMKNPLFNIQMNIVPMHPENWFIDDISFTLTWRRSF